MFENLILAAIVGWCGTVPRPYFPPIPIPPPPICPMCGRFAGAIVAVITIYAFGSFVTSGGILTTVAVSFFAGAFGSDLANNIGGQFKSSK